jgi:hypothetical protein
MNTSRLGDIAVGTCFAHETPLHVVGTIISGSTNTYCNNMNVARTSDPVLFNCGHIGVIISSSKNKCNNLSIAKITDSVVGPMISVLVTGSPNTNTI